MSKFLRFGLTTLALLFVFNIFAVTETKAQIVNKILDTMDAHYKALSSLQANVKMNKHNAQLGENDVIEGTVKYLPLKGRDALVRIDWMKPVQESLAVVNKEYVIYTPRLGRAIVGKVDKAQGSAKSNSALAFMNMSKAQLKANYNMKYLGEEKVGDGTLTWHLELTPKIKTTYKVADIWVDGNGMPIQMRVTENNNDSTTVFLSNLIKNQTLNTKVFVIPLPKGTKKLEG
ncbi:MAG: outer membrane lipoprotein carrier protein LolA [Acidobacteriota bacterium]|nr:outer membrane lipoprotein carrier protein LolA [Acidobacteriota bacterium]